MMLSIMSARSVRSDVRRAGASSELAACRTFVRAAGDKLIISLDAAENQRVRRSHYRLIVVGCAGAFAIGSDAQGWRSREPGFLPKPSASRTAYAKHLRSARSHSIAPSVEQLRQEGSACRLAVQRGSATHFSRALGNVRRLESYQDRAHI